MCSQLQRKTNLKTLANCSPADLCKLALCCCVSVFSPAYAFLHQPRMVDTCLFVKRPRSDQHLAMACVWDTANGLLICLRDVGCVQVYAAYVRHAPRLFVCRRIAGIVLCVVSALLSRGLCSGFALCTYDMLHDSLYAEQVLATCCVWCLLLCSAGCVQVCAADVRHAP